MRHAFAKAMTGRAALFTGAGVVALAAAAPGFAQTTATIPDEEEVARTNTGTTGEQIIVTGSRIARPNLESTTPIASVTAQDLTERGTPNIGDALAELPALGSAFTQANSTRFIGTAGINTLDLRDLGSARTLVLVNGRRHVTSQPGTYDVDTNTIPSDLLERVDLVTGGNSAVYGSDAIAGVVNFILRRDFDGVRVRGQAGLSDEGDAAGYFASITAGRNLFDNRLNVAFSAEWDRQDQLLSRQRDSFTGALSGFPNFTTTEPTTTYNPLTRTTTPVPNRNNNGIPNTTLVRGLRFAQLNENGMLQTVCPYLTNAQYDALSPAARARHEQRLQLSCASVTRDPQGRLVPNSFTPTGGGVNHFWSFDPTGQFLVRSVPTGDLRPQGGGVIGGLGSTGLEEAQLRPELERYAFNVLLNADLGTAFRPFLEAKYVRIDAVQQSTQPTFSTGLLRSTFRLDNPFLTPQARQQIIEINGLDPAAPAVVNGTQTFQSFRFNYDLGTRSEDHRRELWRIVGGVAGDLSTTGNLRYEVALNYGRSETYYDTGGNINIARYNNATDAARDANGNIVCRINLNPATADPACAPLNPFGYGNASQAARDYVLAVSSREQWAEQLNATAFISGDSSGFFNLPGGPAGFALGVEYRREDAFSAYDDFTVSGQSFLNAIGAFDPPAQTIREAFAELRVPILAAVPFFNELTVEGAVRVSDYNTQDDLVWAYNAGVIWSPFQDLRIRAAYGRAVRAPNIGNLYSTQSETFLNGLVDPCNQTVINENPNRARNCAAAGIPTTIVVGGETRPWTNVAASGISGFNQGNPNLSPEKSDSITVGFVYQPSFLSGFSFSADYYDIKVSEVISGLDPQAIINRCYDDPVGLDNPFCAAVFRRRTNDPLTDFTFQGQQNRTFPGVPQIDIPRIGPSFINQPFNFAELRARGIDFEVAYVGALSDTIRLNSRLLVTHNLERENFTFITDPERSTRLNGVLGIPEWAASLFSTLDFGEVDFSYNARFVSRMTVGAWETQFSHQGRPPENPDAFPFTHYPDILYHNIRFGFEPEGTRFRFYAGVDNVLDQLPPSPLDGRGAGSGIYPNVGRFFYAGAVFTF
ncbi:TonB-dependent receptor [Erythrobacteraceae bacterium CFH 75059]|uniref:TonB-dependent receptor domain-containing protein n=1 Tax=Qipengyuania thermophila TaxID=2509361 RepID=UPI001020BA75|nr:TonB-dependent receptor [Qipengyuania thermophila]TCD06229.1 TonB-dependent receptor [Erythrobacteraceae bacterium CFH 75059]